MPEPNRCAECGAPLPAYWPKGLCAQCALGGALEMTHAASQVLQPEAPDCPTSVRPAQLSTEASPLGMFGDYHLLDEIARGGMGVVYKARQRSLGRIVAVKMILAGPHAGKEFVQRFRTEASAAAILQHPNIVAIHDVGVQEGRHYFSMDYVEGRNLAQLVNQQPLPPTKAARYVELVAAAIHYAHERGILHRDLKPSNVLVDANDQPRVTDFGLAKRFGVPPPGRRGPVEPATPTWDVTVTGQVLGSPNFMPPEQAGGRRSKVGRASDVYALGGVLYYLLTARAPFQAESLEHVITQVLNVYPVAPRLLNPSIPRDLETITLKCLEKDPSRRYQTAQELADELGRVLRHEPIKARPVNAAEKVWRWCRRKPAIASALGFAITALLVGFAATTWQWRRAERNALSERQQRERAEGQTYISDMNRVQQALVEHNLRHARQLLDRHRPKERETDWRGWEWRYLWERARGGMELTLHEQEGNVFFYAGFLSDGTRVATFDKAGRVSLWDVATRTEVLSLQGDLFDYRPDDNQSDNSGQASLSIDGDLLAARSRAENGKPSIKVWKTATGELMAEFPCDRSWATAVTFSPDKQKLAAFMLHEAVRVWDLSTRQLKFQRQASPTGHSDCCTHGAVTFSPDGGLLAIGDGDGRVRLIELAAELEYPAFKASTEGIFTLAFSPDGHILAAAAGYNTALITVWDVPNRTNLCTLQGHKGWVASLAFSPDGKTLASASGDGMVKLWDPATWKEKRTLRHPDSVSFVAFSKDGKKLVTAGDDVVNIWSASKEQPDHGALSVSLVGRQWDVAPDNTTLVIARHGIVSLRGLVPDKMDRTLSVLGTNNAAVFWPATGDLLAASSEPPEIKVWNLASSTLTTHPLKLEGSLSRWLFLPKTGTILIGHTNSVPTNWTFTRWHVRTRRQGSTLSVNKDIWAIAVSADEHSLLIGTRQGSVSLFNLETGQEEASFQTHSMGVQALALLPDGKFLVTAGEEGAFMKVWNLVTRKEVKRLSGHNVAVDRIVLSLDGSRMATTSIANWPIGREPIRIWDTKSWEEVANLVVDSPALSVARFLPDGNTLAATDANGTLYLWRAPTLDEIDQAERAQPNQR